MRFLESHGADFTMSNVVLSLLPDYVFEESDERRELQEYLQSRGVDLLRWK